MAATALSSREVVVGPGTPRARPAAALRCLGGSRMARPRGLRGLGARDDVSAASPQRDPGLADDRCLDGLGPHAQRRLPQALLVSLRARRDRSAPRRRRRGRSWRSSPACSRRRAPRRPAVQMFRTMPALAWCRCSSSGSASASAEGRARLARRVRSRLHQPVQRAPRHRREARRAGGACSASGAASSSARSCCPARCPARRAAVRARDRVARARRGRADQRHQRHRLH